MLTENEIKYRLTKPDDVVVNFRECNQDGWVILQIWHKSRIYNHPDMSIQTPAPLAELIRKSIFMYSDGIEFIRAYQAEKLYIRLKTEDADRGFVKESGKTKFVGCWESLKIADDMQVEEVPADMLNDVLSMYFSLSAK